MIHARAAAGKSISVAAWRRIKKPRAPLWLRRQRPKPRRQPRTSRVLADFAGHFIDEEADGLTRDSNAVVDLVDEGRLDEVERAARELLERYPEVHDGYDRLGMVYEARGDRRQAADKVTEFARAHPRQHDPEFTTIFEGLIAELGPRRPAERAGPNAVGYDPGRPRERLFDSSEHSFGGGLVRTQCLHGIY